MWKYQMLKVLFIFSPHNSHYSKIQIWRRWWWSVCLCQFLGRIRFSTVHFLSFTHLRSAQTWRLQRLLEMWFFCDDWSDLVGLGHCQSGPVGADNLQRKLCTYCVEILVFSLKIQLVPVVLIKVKTWNLCQLVELRSKGSQKSEMEANVTWTWTAVLSITP